MEHDRVKSDLNGSLKQILVTVIMTALFALIGFIFSLVFKENAYPIEKGYIALYPDEWAAVFLTFFIVATIVCFICNMAAIFLAVYKKGGHRRTGAWLTWLIITFLIGIVLGLVFFVKYPEDTWCMVAALILIAAEPVIIFVISTLFASNMWKMGYNPFSR